MQVGERVVLIRDVKELKKGMEGTINELPVFNKFYTVNFGELGIYYMDCESMKIIEEAKSALQTQEGGDHYRKMGMYQPWEVAFAQMTPEEFKGAMKLTVMSYLAREADKGGMQDIKKAAHTLQIYLELEARRVTP